MKSEAYAIAKLQADRQLLHDVVTNPIVGAIAGILAVEWIHEQFIEKGWVGDLGKDAIELGIMGIATAQAFAPIAPYAAQSASGLAPLLALAAPK